MRLLRYINSAFFGLAREVTSVRQALVLVGMDNLSDAATALEGGYFGDAKLLVEGAGRIYVQALLLGARGFRGAVRVGWASISALLFA